MVPAKGLPDRTILYKHAVRNALLRVATQLAVTIGPAAGRRVVVEVVFSWPGLGHEIFNTVRTSDFPLALAQVARMEHRNSQLHVGFDAKAPPALIEQESGHRVASVLYEQADDNLV